MPNIKAMLRGETSAKLQAAILTREAMAMILDMRMVRLKFIKSFETSSFVFELAQLRTLKEEWRGWWGNRTNLLKELVEALERENIDYEDFGRTGRNVAQRNRNNRRGEKGDRETGL